MGFEAILAGHKPHVFGQPFYAGWGLSKDRRPITGRNRCLSHAQLFAAAMILYPIWCDPYRDQLCALKDVLDTLEAQSRAWRDDHRGWVPVRRYFGNDQICNLSSADQSGLSFRTILPKPTAQAYESSAT